MARDAPRGRLFAEIAEEPGEIFFRIRIHHERGRQFATRIHPHIERAAPHHAETAFGVFELARRHAEVEKRAADPDDPQLIENFSRVAEVCLAQRDARAELRQPFARMLDRIGILIERENIRARPENFRAVAAAAASPIHDERARARRQQLDRFGHEHRTMISEILHFLRLLHLERTSREPDGPLK